MRFNPQNKEIINKNTKQYPEKKQDSFLQNYIPVIHIFLIIRVELTCPASNTS